MKKMKFTDCVDIVGSSCHKFDGTKVYVSTGAVDTDRIEPLDTEIVDYDGRPSRANLVAEENDILFAKMQATEKTLLIDEELSKHIYSTGFCAVRAKDHIITNKCLYYLLTSETFLEQKDKNCSGATQKAITNAGLEKIVISVPDLEQQTAFVEQMDAVRNMIAYRKEQLKKLDELVKSRFIELFGDPSSNPMGWKETTVGAECYYIKDGPHKSLPDVGEGNGYPFISVRNIVNGHIDFSTAKYISEQDYLDSIKKCHPQKGDMLYSKGGTTGIAKLIDVDVEFANWVHVAVLKFDDTLNGVFFENMLNCEYCYDQSQRLTKGIANRDLVLSAMAQKQWNQHPCEC